MRALTWLEYLDEAEPRLLKVFNEPETLDFWCEPFLPSIESKLLIAPYKFVIESPITEALIAAARAEGTEACYVSLFWRELGEPNPTYPNDWYVPMEEFKAAYEGDEVADSAIWKSNASFGLSDSAIYSIDADWGIWTNHEWFGVIGGTKEFVASFRDEVPEIDQQVFQFLEYINNIRINYGRHATLGWVRPLLESIYGSQKTLNLLLESGLAVGKSKGIKILI